MSFGTFESLIHMPSIISLLQVDIWKRLQRQAFYDIMQLRERQEKVERVLSLFKASKVGPFAEESTQVKGVINVAGVTQNVEIEGEQNSHWRDRRREPLRERAQPQDL